METQKINDFTTKNITYNIMNKFLLLTIGCLFLLSGCIHDNFDSPPLGGSDPEIDESLIITIDDLKDQYLGADAQELTDSVFIRATVIADDRSGTFYQTIVLEDETAGIAIRIGTASFYNIYPIGRRVFVLVKGLYIGQYNGLVQLGVQDPDESDGVERIPNFLVQDYFFPGQTGQDRTPTTLTITELEANRIAYQNRLIKLENVEFEDDELGQTYADAANQQTVNRDIEDCNGNSLLLRNSGFAEFAGDSIPCGNGSLIAVFSTFGNDNQLFLRETEDIAFDNARCDGSFPVACGGEPVPCTDNSSPLNGVLEDFESAELFEPISMNDWKTINVVGSGPWVARDFDNNQYALVQGFNAGSAIESWLVSPKMNFDEAESLSFESKIGFWVHDGLKVFISTDFDGCNVTDATWTELTSAIIANSSNSPDGVGGYANDFVNSGNVDISSYSGIGYIGFQYIGDDNDNTTTYQIDNVNIGDEIIIVPPTCEVENSINEDFESLDAFESVDLECWDNVTTVGEEAWEGREFSNNLYAQISGFNSPSATIETYLISPEFDLAEANNLNFDSKIGFCVHDGLTVAISTDYNGTDPSSATWTTLTANLASSSNSSCNGGYGEFINSGNVDLSSFSGTGHIAFIYNGTNNDGGQTTTFQVDNVVID